MIVDQVRVVLARVLKLFVVSLAFLGLIAPVASAQEDDESSATVAEERDTEVEEVIVTGSRLKRDTFSSISPLQVISGQVSREIGVIDPGTILHESTATSGVQFDLTFGAFVVDNGPASTTVDLRGLGASRTLFLLNGRRLAPSGVEGAPSSPDVNLIPSSLVQQYEVLLDGASSVYGSDAVAGVVNVVLEQDFEGLELEAFTNIPAGDNSEGMRNTISAKWGYNGDRGYIGFGAEYNEIQPLTLADRRWSDQCETHSEITTDGERRTTDLYYPEFFGMEIGDCRVTSLAGYTTELSSLVRIGSMFYEDGVSNTTIPNMSDYNAFGVIIDTTGDGQADVNFTDYNFNGNDLALEVVPEIETQSFMSYGEYTFSGDANITPYYELQWNRRQSDGTHYYAQLFPQVNPLNPFNPCNPNQPNGVDCGLANDAFFTDPAVEAAFIEYYGAPPSALGILIGGPIGASVWMQPVVHVEGDRNRNTTDVQQLRVVGGVRGDIPALNFGSVEDWSWDFYVTATSTDGESSIKGIRGDRLDLALGNYSATGTPCDNSGVPVASDTAAGCVPVNMWAPSLYANIVNNDFASPQERDYIWGERFFDTEIKQSVASYYMSGDIFEMPGGTALFGLGVEWRKDEIDSIPNETAAEGLFFGFSADQGAIGEKTTKEFFAEMELPLFAGNPGMEELTFNVSTRYTDDEFYDAAWTHSVKLAYRPVESLLLRATTGTSFRAPNLRENFLAFQTGFNNVSDPCVIPDVAVDVNGNYIPGNDNRPAVVLQNCELDPGVDPYTFVNNGLQVYNTEISAGGSLDLEPETSESFSAGLVWEQPFWESFDLVFGGTYYDIKIRNEIIEPSFGFIVADCYNDPEFDSAFCTRISRDPDQSIGIIDEGFINRDILRARGVDLNMRVDIPTQMFGRAVDFAADFAFNRALELSTKVLDGGGEAADDRTGEFGRPEWQGRGTLRADVGNWRYTFSTRYVSSVQIDEDSRDDFDNIFTGFADTCIGPENGDVNCRDVDFADNYFTHDASVFYLGDTWTVGVGLRNLTDQRPPHVDGLKVGSFNNSPRGRGYDIWGRTAFVNVVYNWQ